MLQIIRRIMQKDIPVQETLITQEPKIIWDERRAAAKQIAISHLELQLSSKPTLEIDENWDDSIAA